MTGSAMIAEIMAVELLPGSYFSVAMAATIAIAAKFGPLPALLSLAAQRLVLPTRLGNVYAALIYGMEILFIGLMKRRRPTFAILKLDAAFWPLIGCPLIAAIYYFALGVTFETTLVTLCKVWLVGLLCAQIADSVVDSKLVRRLLGQPAPPPARFGDFMKNRLNFIIIPISLLGLFAVVSGIRGEAEDSLLLRLQGGIERVRLAAAWTEDARAAFDSFAAAPSPLDREGRFEVLDVSSPLLGSARPWRAGTYVCEPLRAPHPTDGWRDSVYFAQTEVGGRLVRYSLPFEPYFLRILRYYIAGMVLSLVLVYGGYVLLSLVARALTRRMGALIAVSGSLPAKIERGEEPDWPRLDILDLRILEDEFSAVAHELRATFGELTASRDALDSAVKERTRELESMSAEIRLLLARVEKEREGERIRVARELHDEFGQGITGLGMALHILERRLGNLDERDKEKFADMRTAIADLTERMRHLIADLRPSVLDRLGLSEALERLALERGGPDGPAIEYSSSLPQDFSPSEEIKSSVYRIAQEAVTNAIKYSSSSMIRMSLELTDGAIVLQVADSGRGFDMDSVKAGQDRTAFGIIGMRERCRALGGTFSLQSAPLAGTVVRASFASWKKEE